MKISLQRGVAALTIAATVLIVSALPASASLAGAERRERPDRPVETSIVTLVTGDVVRVSELGDGSRAASVEQRGSTGGVQTYHVGDDLYVVPDAALRYLAANRLDSALFNVTALIDQGYGDESANAVPLIAKYAPKVRSSSGRRAPTGSRKTRDLESINGAAIRMEKDDAHRFWNELLPAGASSPALAARFANDITKIWLDGQVEAQLADSVPQVRAPTAWRDGYAGAGATVAVLDSGVDATHPDLVDRVQDAMSFVPDDPDASRDENGHGTHVASTIAGSGAASDGAYKGVAPEADLVVGKVLSDDGYGLESWVIDGMEWAAGTMDVDVVNMSLGDSVPSDGNDPLSQAVNELTAKTGALFVVAAGNNYTELSIGSPGAADAALTVGAVDGWDEHADFSSMGPRFGDFALKPDLSAPGVDVTAARSQQIPLGEGWYQSLDGTSMATPHVAGAAAILAGKRPGWTASRLKDALVSSSEALPGTSPYEVGVGRLDVPAALDDVDATGSAYFGFFRWPHDGDAPVRRVVSFRNEGSSPVTLSLDDAVAGPEGPAPDLFALSASEVTVPAGGQVDVTVTADVDDAPAVGRYSGFVVATDASGTVRARTAIGLVKEEERYDLQVKAVDRRGEPASGFVVLYEYGTAYPSWLQLDPETGRLPVQRLRPGVYNVTTWMEVEGSGGPDTTGVALLGNPHLELGADQELVLDARRANRVSIRTPLRSEDRYRRMQYHHNSGIGGEFETFSNTYTVSGDVDDLFAAPTGTVPGKEFDFAVRWRRSAPLLDLSAHLPARVPIDPLYQPGSARLDGRVALAGVYAGTGSSAEYEGIEARGRAVVVTRSDDVWFWERELAAAEAGAALLVVVNDDPGRLYEFAGFTDVPVVSLTKSQGSRLVAAARAGTLTIRGEAVARPEYMYDLVFNDPRGVPASLAYAPRRSELAQIDHRFVGKRPQLVYEGRYDCRAYQWPPCMGPWEPVETGSTRTDYVSTQDGVLWYQDVFLPDGMEQRHEQARYRAGQRTSLDWLAPVTRPRLGPGYWGPFRDQDVLQVNVPIASGPSPVTGSMLTWLGEAAGTVKSRLYHGDVLLNEQDFQAAVGEAPTADRALYRFEQDTERPASPWRTSIRTRSSWTFVSERPDPSESALLPLLQLDYSVETDLAGDARSTGTNRIGVSASHVDGVVGAGRVQGVTLELSFDDGATWRPAVLQPARGGGWETTVTYPRGTPFVSLRATAWDDAGNRVEQEIVRAYGLR